MASTPSSNRAPSQPGRGRAHRTAIAVFGLAALYTACVPAQQNKGVIELMNQLETLRADLGRLRGELEVLNNSMEHAQRRQRDMYLDLDTRMRRLEGAAPEAGHKHDKALSELDVRIKRLEESSASASGIGEIEVGVRRLETAAGAVLGAPPSPGVSPSGGIAQPTPPAPPSVARPSPPAANVSASRRAYDSALALYRNGDFQGAVSALESFVKRYPHDSLAPNAQYWAGDAWFHLRDFTAAVRTHRALIATYPDSSKVPDAMLSLASAQAALGENAAARKTLEELIARYPQADTAEKARQRLPRLR